VLLSALQITMREPTVAWRLLWQAPYSDVRHVAPHVKLMSDLIVGRWWRDGTRVPDGPDDFDAEVPRTDFDRSPRCYSWDIALSFAPLFSTYGSAVNTLPYAAIGALRAVIRGRRATPLPPPPFDAGAGALWLSLTHNPDLSPSPNADSKAPPPIGVADKAGAVLLQRKRGILGGKGRSLLNEAAKLAPHSAGSTHRLYRAFVQPLIRLASKPPHACHRLMPFGGIVSRPGPPYHCRCLPARACTERDMCTVPD